MRLHEPTTLRGGIVVFSYVPPLRGHRGRPQLAILIFSSVLPQLAILISSAALPQLAILISSSALRGIMEIQSSEQEQGLSSSFEQNQGLSSNIAFQAYVFFLTMLGALIQVKFQGSSISPFEKHNAIISSFLVVISIYAGSVILGKKFGLQTIGPIRLLSGTLAPVLLMLILVPKFGWLLLILWVFLAAKIVRQQPYRHLYCQASGQVSNLFARFRSPPTFEEDSPV